MPRRTAAIHATLQEDMAAMAMASGVAKNCTPVQCRTTKPSPGTVARALQLKYATRNKSITTALKQQSQPAPSNIYGPRAPENVF
jgi:hypothetical protein